MSTRRKSRDYQNRIRWKKIRMKKRYRRDAGLRALVLGLEVVAAIALVLLVIKCVGILKQTNSAVPGTMVAAGEPESPSPQDSSAGIIDESTDNSSEPSSDSSEDTSVSDTEPESSEEETAESRVLDPDKPMVAFTFDDGPNPDVTNRILDAMEAVGGRVTFFVMGNRVSKFPKVLTRAYEMGCEIGNHSFDHPQFSKISDDDIRYQIEHTNDLINEIIPIRADVVRVPYGDFGGNVMSVVDYPMIQWNVDTLDWKTKNKDMIMAEIRKEISDGDIILMHDLYKTTGDAFVEIVPELVEQGYQFVTVRELIEAKGKTLDNGVIYYFAD